MSRQQRTWLLRAVVWLMVPLALHCDGERLTVGDDVATSPATETWVGYTENVRFRSGTDRITVAFQAETEATVVFGDASPLPSVVDENVGDGRPVWYASASSLDAESEATLSPDGLRRASERFAYRARELRRERTRLQFGVDLGEIWKRWCPRQGSEIRPSPYSPYLSPRRRSHRFPVFACASDEADPVRKWLCLGDVDAENGYETTRPICACDGGGCRLAPAARIVRFDLRMEGGHAEGSWELGHIHLDQQRPDGRPSAPAPLPRRWSGYFESYRFASGSDALTIELDGPTEGSVVLGPPPGDNDPINERWFSVGAPVGRVDVVQASSFSFGRLPSGDLWARSFLEKRAERLRHAIYDLVIEGPRIRFRVNLMDSWAPRCAALKSHPRTDRPGEFTCLTEERGGGSVAAQGAVDRVNLALCSESAAPICICGPTECHLAHRDEPLLFDLRVAGNSTATGASDLGRVRLSGAPP